MGKEWRVSAGASRRANVYRGEDSVQREGIVHIGSLRNGRDTQPRARRVERLHKRGVGRCSGVHCRRRNHVTHRRPRHGVVARKHRRPVPSHRQACPSPFKF